MSDPRPGLVALLGSGETSPTGGRVFEEIARRIARPPRIAVLETPAGFELNSAQVAGRVADFVRLRLQNYSPDVVTIPARKRNTAFSPDDLAFASHLLEAELIFMGPGSPTYAARQLQDSRAWHTLIARHRIGARLCSPAPRRSQSVDTSCPSTKSSKQAKNYIGVPDRICLARMDSRWRSSRIGTTPRAAPTWTPAGASWRNTLCRTDSARLLRLGKE